MTYLHFHDLIVLLCLLKLQDPAAVLVQFGEFDSGQPIQETTRSGNQTFGQKLIALSQIMKEVVCINEELQKFGKARIQKGIPVAQNLEDTISTTDNSSAVLNPLKKSSIKDSKLVGLEEDFKHMLHCLTNETEKTLKVHTVIGMAGIGKTTFAKKLYEHPRAMQCFDVHAWVTVSQEYQPVTLFLNLLSCITNLPEKEKPFADQLYQQLCGRRYLIVLDDVWDKKVWNYLWRFFPDDNNSSRVLLTARLETVATHASPNGTPHHLRTLNQEESWELLCSKVFSNDDEPFPPGLIPVGKQIADKCYGLPLAIVVVGGLLSTKERTKEVCEELAKNVGSMVMDKTQRCKSILALSCNHLPEPLKACFLYMAVFPEDIDIPCKKLIRLWMAEGFVQPNEQKTLEKVAEDYLEDLIARHLIMVKIKGRNGRIKICHLHDLMRELCLGESGKENFLHVIRDYGQTSVTITNGTEADEDLQNLPRLAFHSGICMYMKNIASFPFTRSFFCFESLRPMDLKGCSGIYFKILKILDLMHVHLLSLPQGILLSNLKYMALTIQNSLLLSELSKFQRLQTCIMDGEWIGSLSEEFWNMSELRHFHLMRRSSSLPPYSMSHLTPEVRSMPN